MLGLKTDSDSAAYARGSQTAKMAAVPKPTQCQGGRGSSSPSSDGLKTLRRRFGSTISRALSKRVYHARA
jgi:hypothetical protein